MVTFFIGNGFDLQIGLKTKFEHFYDTYAVVHEEDSDVIIKFKNDITEDKDKYGNYEKWADFESYLGKYIERYSNSEHILEWFNDFVFEFDRYLVYECAKIDWENIDKTTINNFRNSIRTFYSNIKSIRPDDSLRMNYIETSVNFIQFNYTDAFNRLIEEADIGSFGRNKGFKGIVKLGDNLNVHGTCGGGHIVMGLDNETQIVNKPLIDSTKDFIVKPLYLNMHHERDVNQTDIRETALAAISKSSVFCAFGCSMGETDIYWWEAVGERLKAENVRFVIFDKCVDVTTPNGSVSIIVKNRRYIEKRKNEIIKQFLTTAKLDENWYNENQEKIIVELNSDMFGFQLPKIEAQ